MTIFNGGLAGKLENKEACWVDVAITVAFTLWQISWSRFTGWEGLRSTKAPPVYIVKESVL